MNTQNDYTLSVDSTVVAVVSKRCWCGEEPHPALNDCPHCEGNGHIIADDDYRPCSRCKMRQRALNAK